MEHRVRRIFGRQDLNHGAPVHLLRASPDGGRVLSASASESRYRCWDPRTRRIVWELPVSLPTMGDVAFEDGGKIALLGTSYGEILSVRVDTGEVVARRDLARDGGKDMAIFGLRFSPDGSRVVLKGFGTATLYDLAGRRTLGSLVGATSEVLVDCQFSPDSRRLLGGFGDGRLLVWDASTGRDPRELVKLPAWVRMVGWMPGAEQVIAGTRGGRVAVHDAGTGELVHAAMAVDGDVTFVLPLEDGSALVGGEEEIVQYDFAAGHGEKVGEGSGAITAAALSADRTLLLTGHASGGIHVFDLTTRRCLDPEGDHRGRVLGLWSDENALYSWGSDQQFGIWDRASGTATFHRMRPGGTRAFDFAPIRARALCPQPGGDMEILLLDEGSFTKLGRLRGSGKTITHCSMFHQGDLAISMDEDSTICLWDVGSATRKGKGSLTGANLPWYRRFEKRSTSRDRPIRTFKLEENCTLEPAVSPDGRRLLAVGGDHLVVWSFESPKPGLEIPIETSPPPRACFSSDGRSIFAHRESSGTLSIFDAISGRPAGSLEVSSHEITHLLEIPDRRELLVSCADGTASWWSLETRQRTGRFDLSQEAGADAPVSAARCEQDGIVWLGTARGLIVELVPD